jgi:hypothetical protein
LLKKLFRTFMAHCFWLLVISMPHATLAKQIIVAAVDEDIIADYQLFVGERDPLTINYFGGPGARRDVVEVVLLQQALYLGGLPHKVVLRPENSYLRILKLLNDGQVAVSAALMWREDIKPYYTRLYKTHAIVKEGQFIAGLYTRASNQKVLQADSLEKISALSAASNTHWKADITTLKELGVKKIYNSTYWVQIVRMVVAGRADFTLAPFQSNEGMKVKVDDLELIPIPGIKVTLPGSRHWPVSKIHPQGKLIFDALERGIIELNNKNIIQTAYEQCGFFHPEVKDWRLINRK